MNNKLIGELNEERIEYEIIEDYPILIDFEKSVLKREQIKSLSSVTERYSYTGLLSIVKDLVSPPKSATAENVEQILSLLLNGNDSARVLIVGGGSIGQGMDPFYKDSRIELVAFDIYASPWVQFLADAHNIPLPENYFDAVIIQAVLEHVLVPDKVVSEIYRVLKSNGVVYAETPFLQHVHEGAYDFTRFTESGHRYLFRKFELIKSGASAGAGTQLLWSLDNFARGIFRSRKLGKIIKLLFFWLQYCDRLIPAPYNIDSASGVFFLGKKQNSEINVEEIITHYKGAQ
jgi:SAM-dependent methyltransferase